MGIYQTTWMINKQLITNVIHEIQYILSDVVFVTCH